MSEKSFHDLFPPRDLIERFLQKANARIRDTPFWQYYDTGLFGKLNQIVFRTRYQALHRFLGKTGFRPKRALDIGCGCMLLAFGLLSKFDLEYIGLDIKPSSELREYSTLIGKDARKDLHIVRASAESLPFREDLFDLILAFDVLEHLENPKVAVIEPIRVASENGIFVVSVPLEKLFHRVARILGGILIGTPWRIGQKPPYHYASENSSYDQIVKCLCENYKLVKIAYTPFGLAPLSINGILFNRIEPKKRTREGFATGPGSRNP